MKNNQSRIRGLNYLSGSSGYCNVKRQTIHLREWPRWTVAWGIPTQGGDATTDIAVPLTHKQVPIGHKSRRQGLMKLLLGLEERHRHLTHRRGKETKLKACSLYPKTVTPEKTALEACMSLCAVCMQAVTCVQPPDKARPTCTFTCFSCTRTY